MSYPRAVVDVLWSQGRVYLCPTSSRDDAK